MSTVELKLSGLSTRGVRVVAATLSALRTDIATYNHSGSIAPHWAPVVHCEGPELFGLVTPVIPLSVASAVLQDLADMGEKS